MIGDGPYSGDGRVIQGEGDRAASNALDAIGARIARGTHIINDGRAVRFIYIQQQGITGAQGVGGGILGCRQNQRLPGDGQLETVNLTVGALSADLDGAYALLHVPWSPREISPYAQR